MPWSRTLSRGSSSNSVSIGRNCTRSIPRLIMVRMPTFGLDGPWHDHVGFAPTMEQLSGMAWRTGFSDGAPMAPRGACDPIAGAHAVVALLAALSHRDRTGVGQLVEIPMVEVALNLTAEQVHRTSGARCRPAKRGKPRGRCAAERLPLCRRRCVDRTGRGDGCALARLGARTRLAGVVRRPGAGHVGRPASGPRRARCSSPEWFARRPLAEAVATLLAAGVPAAEVVVPPAVVENEQLVDRDFFEEFLHPDAGWQHYAGLPFHAQPVGGWCRRPPPTLGEHNDEVLGSELGLAQEALSELRARQVIGDRPLGL